MIKGLMVDVDGVLVCGRPSDGQSWASALPEDLGISLEDLQCEFFRPHWSEIVIGQAELPDRLEPVLARIAPHLSCDEFIGYWFENDARLNIELLEELDRQRSAGMPVWLATNQEHLRAAYLMDVLALAGRCDGICYSAAMGCRKPEAAFFEKAAARSGLPAEHLLLIDDTSANVVAAQAAGWYAAEWREGSSLAAVLAAFEA